MIPAQESEHSHFDSNDATTCDEAVLGSNAPDHGASKSLADLGIQRYHVASIHRSELKNAAYNPRHITDKERAQLKGVLARHGLVEPLVWNKRTGNIVGGHQRISICDKLADTQDYTLDVSIIDVSETRERELNIALNNDHAMGQFDLEQLKAIFADEDVTVVGAGFSHADMIQLFGESTITDRSADLQEFADHLAKIAEQYDAIRDKNKKKAETEHFIVVVFPSGEHVSKFLTDNGLDENRYQNGQILAERLNAKICGPTSP